MPCDVCEHCSTYRLLWPVKDLVRSVCSRLVREFGFVVLLCPNDGSRCAVAGNVHHSMICRSPQLCIRMVSCCDVSSCGHFCVKEMRGTAKCGCEKFVCYLIATKCIDQSVCKYKAVINLQVILSFKCLRTHRTHIFPLVAVSQFMLRQR